MVRVVRPLPFGLLVARLLIWLLLLWFLIILEIFVLGRAAADNVVEVGYAIEDDDEDNKELAAAGE